MTDFSLYCSSTSLEDFTSGITQVDNRTLVSLTADAILSAAIMNRMRGNDGQFDQRCTALMNEGKRRGNRALYDLGYNEAMSSQGHPTSPVESPVSFDFGDPTINQAVTA